MKNKLFITSLAAITMGLVGCSKGFQNLANPSTEKPAAQGGTEPNPDPAVNGWDKVDFKGYQAGGTNNNALVIHIDKVHQSLLFVLPIPMIIPIVSQIEIPDLPGAYITNYVNPNGGGDSLAISIPLHYIIKGGAFMPNEKLPNGDDLPFVPAGELPGFAIQFPQMPEYQIHLYIGVNVAAVFAELQDVGLNFGFILPVKNQAKTKVVGAIGYVMPKFTYPGGIYLAAQLPADLARVIDDLIRW